jgi:hypothetical protein
MTSLKSEFKNRKIFDVPLLPLFPFPVASKHRVAEPILVHRCAAIIINSLSQEPQYASL